MAHIYGPEFGAPSRSEPLRPRKGLRKYLFVKNQRFQVMGRKVATARGGDRRPQRFFIMMRLAAWDINTLFTYSPCGFNLWKDCD
jgi:hypothetical protein